MESGILTLGKDAHHIAEKMKPKNKALQAQDLYLQTKDQKYLVQFYNHLLGLGWTIQEKEEMVNKNPETVIDIVNGVVLRLMESQEPVVRSAPSAYLKTALFYQNKNQFHDSLDESEDVAAEDSETDDYDAFVERIVADLPLDMGKEVDSMVKATLEARIDWHIVYRNLPDESLKREYRKSIIKVRDYAKKNLQGNGVLSVSRATEQVLS